MAANKRDAIQRLQDHARIAELKLRGWNNTQIALALGTTRQMVIYDLKAIEAEWRKDTQANFSIDRARELMRLDRIIHDAYAGFDRSVVEKKRTRTRQRSSRGAGESATLARIDEAVVDTEAQVGDPRWLAVALRATEQRIRVLQLEAPPSGPDVNDQPVREIVIRMDAPLEPSNDDVASDAGVPVEGAYRAVDGNAVDLDEDESRVITTPPKMLRGPAYEPTAEDE